MDDDMQRDKRASSPASNGIPSAATLLALADRCEREEPSRELDVRISFAIYGDRPVGHKGPYTAPQTVMLSEMLDNPAALQIMVSDDDVPESVVSRFTTSLDFAVTLRPPGLAMVMLDDGGFFASFGSIPRSEARTLALALCAAALRARAASDAVDGSSTRTSSAESASANQSNPEGRGTQ